MLHSLEQTRKYACDNIVSNQWLICLCKQPYITKNCNFWLDYDLEQPEKLRDDRIWLINLLLSKWL